MPPDVETQIVEQPVVEATPALLGSTDPTAAMGRAIEMAELLDRVVRDRGLARTFGESERAFYEWPAWQILATWLQVTAVVVWTRRIDDGWEARAEARRLDGAILGASEAMCSASERGRRHASDHDRRAMAQVRAQRNALRSAIGFIPALAGLDVSDPDAPATRKQVVALHTLAGELAWDHEESHNRAGVETFRDLTREQAATLLDTWSELVDTETARERADDPADEHAVDAEAPLPGATLDQAWAAAIAHRGSRLAVLQAALERWPERNGVSTSSLSLEDVLELAGDPIKVDAS